MWFQKQSVVVVEWVQQVVTEEYVMCEIRKLIIDKFYAVEIIEKLNGSITSAELVERLWDIIEAHVDVFTEEFTVDEELFK